VFAVFDKNGDGSIDFSEFVLAIGLISKSDLDSTLELSFAT
jgi:Ca2+-binding EF-hand superfamily protein